MYLEVFVSELVTGLSSLSEVACRNRWASSMGVSTQPESRAALLDYDSRLRATGQDSSFPNFCGPHGKFAALVTVAGDPLADTGELERVRFVMKNGQLIRNDLVMPR